MTPLERLKQSVALLEPVQTPRPVVTATSPSPTSPVSAFPLAAQSPAAVPAPDISPAAVSHSPTPATLPTVSAASSASRAPAETANRAYSRRRSPSSLAESDPAKLIRPFAEIAASAASVLALGAAFAASGIIPTLQFIPGIAALPLAGTAAVIAASQTLLALRRWKRGKQALALVEDRARRRGITDPLTGLANRAGYRLTVEDALKIREPEQKLGIIYIDLDRFKEVNDNFGHEMGDKLLCAVTARLGEIAEGRAVGARLGGDEFALLVDGCDTAAEIMLIGESISRRMGQPFMIDNAELVIGGSAGVAIAPDDGIEFSELVRRADISMYRAKSAGRGNCIRFDPSMEDNVRQKKIMENEMRHAIERGEMRMVYQPVFAADGETIRGVEALVRWQNPTLGFVSPGDFIPLAEETGLIASIGEWTVRRALEDAQSWPDIGIAVNVSPAQFRAKGLAKSIIDMVAESGIEPKRVEIEVTEGVLIRDADRAAATIKEFHDAGMRVALDDFGTGFASLSYLRRFQFDKLKIDQVFVQTLSTDRASGSGSAAIIHNVVALGRSLGMTVQAEGVETLEHHIFLRAAGCHCLQGYYFARPMEKEAFDAFLVQKRGLGYESHSRFYA
jgi:diguanylate cyclase